MGSRVHSASRSSLRLPHSLEKWRERETGRVLSYFPGVFAMKSLTNGRDLFLDHIHGHVLQLQVNVISNKTGTLKYLIGHVVLEKSQTSSLRPRAPYTN